MIFSCQKIGLFSLLIPLCTTFVAGQQQPRNPSPATANPNPFLPFNYDPLHGFNCEDEKRVAQRSVIDANSTENSTTTNWRDQLEEKRNNYTQELQKCRDSISSSNNTNPDIVDFFDYEQDIASCPDSRNTWKILAIVFIVAFVIVFALLGAVSAMYFIKMKK